MARAQHSWSTYSDGINVLQESLSQFDLPFAPYGHVQCVAMSAASISQAYLCSNLSEWSSDTLNAIIYAGNDYFTETITWLKGTLPRKDLDYIKNNHFLISATQLKPHSRLFDSNINILYDNKSTILGYANENYSGNSNSNVY